ncbi:MAG: sulfocyanin-like copper-binding protein, partial [Actinomycetota bacterium]
MAAADSSTPAASDEEDGGSGAGLILTLLGLTVGAAMFAVVTVGLVSVITDEENTGGSSAAPAAPVEVSLSEYSIDGDLEVGQGGTLAVSNDGTEAHDLSVRGTDLATPQLAAGESAQLGLAQLEPGEYEVFCTIAGHADSGMVAPLSVTAGDPFASGEAAQAEEEGGDGGHGGHGGEDTDWAAVAAVAALLLGL